MINTKELWYNFWIDYLAMDDEQYNDNFSYFHFQYLGSFPVQAVDQGDRAEFVRKQLVSMKVILNIRFQACSM